MAYISFKLSNMAGSLPLPGVSWNLSHLKITASLYFHLWTWEALAVVCLSNFISHCSHSLLHVFQPQWYSSQSLKNATPFSISPIPVIPRSHSTYQITDGVILISHRENTCDTTESNYIGKERSSEQNLIRFHSTWIQLCPNLVINCT